MQLRDLQDDVRQAVTHMKTPYRSGTEVMLALTEELGEVATEVALLKPFYSKWH